MKLIENNIIIGWFFNSLKASLFKIIGELRRVKIRINDAAIVPISGVANNNKPSNVHQVRLVKLALFTPHHAPDPLSDVNAPQNISCAHYQRFAELWFSKHHKH